MSYLGIAREHRLRSGFDSFALRSEADAALADHQRNRPGCRVLLYPVPSPHRQQHHAQTPAPVQRDCVAPAFSPLLLPTQMRELLVEIKALTGSLRERSDP